MGTSKWHLLDHGVQDILDVRSILFFDVGLYEGSHQAVKYQYKLTSRRHRTVMRETLLCPQDLSTCVQENSNWSAKKLVNPNGIEALYQYKSFLVTRAHTASIHDL